MSYKYYCQEEAESIANSILTVPEDYPLILGIAESFRTNFSQVCNLVYNIYFDMVKQPEAYGLFLFENYKNLTENSAQNNIDKRIKKSADSVNRLFDTLFRLFQCGEVQDSRLFVNTQIFVQMVRKLPYGGSYPIPSVSVSRYNLVLTKLKEFGFDISDFNGNGFEKSCSCFTVEYPNNPELINTFKTFFNCCHNMWSKQTSIKSISSLTYKGKPILKYQNAIRFDFRITADQDNMPVQEWINYDLISSGYDKDTIDFYQAFYECSLKYPEIKYDGSYFYKTKRIAQLGNGFISLKLKNLNNYMNLIEKMPKDIRKLFEIGNCRHCGFQGGTKEYCKFRLIWEFDSASHEGCAFDCFVFNSIDRTYIPYYWKLLELEYCL